MSLIEKSRKILGFVFVFGSGVGLVSIHALHLFGENETLVTVLSGILVPILLSIALVVGGLWLWRSGLPGRSVLRVGAWCLVGSAVLGAGAVLIVISQRAKGTVLERGYETQLDHTGGIGLWIVNWIVTESGGEVSFGTNDPTGSVVTLRFRPASTSE